MMLLGLQPVTLRRYTGETWGDDFRPVEAAPSTSTIQASVQAPDPKVMATLPEGERSRGVKRLLTTSELRTREGGVRADEVVIGSDTYEVRTVSHWPALLAHYDVHIVRQQELPAPSAAEEDP